MSTASLLDVLGRRLDKNHLPPLQLSGPPLPILQTRPDLVEALISLSTFPILFNPCEWPQGFNPSGNLKVPSSVLQHYIRAWTMPKTNFVCQVTPSAITLCDIFRHGQDCRRRLSGGRFAGDSQDRGAVACMARHPVHAPHLVRLPHPRAIDHFADVCAHRYRHPTSHQARG